MNFCATCSGLLVGAVFALLGTVIYFFGKLRLGDPTILVLIGVAGVTLGLLQSAIQQSSGGLTRFFTSILFVAGTYLMLVSIDMASKSISVDLFFLALSVLWIQTKISLSQREHKLTCLKCSIQSCKFDKKRD